MKINDNIKPFPIKEEVSLKAFKGHCKIELTDVKTGKKEVQEHDNMVTKALEYFLKQGGQTNPTAFNASILRSDFFTNMVGGMMCLDTALTESDEIVTVPKGVKMTANGAIGVLNNDSPTEMGSYNSSESGWQQDGSFKAVWDYTTSQANGRINCVCLSSYFGGYAGIGNRTSKGTKSGNTAIGNYNSVYSKSASGTYLGYNSNKVHYMTNSLEGVTEWTVKEYSFPYTETDVRDSISMRETNEYTVSLPASISNLQPYYESGGYRHWSAYAHFQSGTTMYMMIAPTSPYGQLVKLVKVIKYNVSTHTITDVLEYTFDSATSKYGVSDKWLLYGDTLTDLTNSANVIETTKNANVNEHFYAQSSDIFYSSASVIDMDLEEENPINGNGVLGIVGQTDNPLLHYGGSALLRDPRYIATIFNLESPVTKTADKTMKVTYVLRFS